MIKKIVIFDLDETVICSKHRYRNLESGSIDLQYWIDNATPEKVAQDKLLPLAKAYHKAISCRHTFVIVATARLCANHDFLYVAAHLGVPNHFISRRAGDSRADAFLKVIGLARLFDSKPYLQGLKGTFYDDNPLNIEAVSKAFEHIDCVQV